MILFYFRNISKTVRVVVLFSLLRVTIPVASSAQSGFQALPSPINVQGTDEFNPSLSANGRILLFSAAMGDFGESKVSISYQKNGVWSAPIPIPQINTEAKKLYNSGHFLSYDGNQIYFSTSKFGGVGGNDIWTCYKTGNTWTNPINLGSPVNSKGNETDPCLSADGRFLFFTRWNAKKTLKGQACGQIFYSQKLTKNTWATPQPLPSPINTGCECNARLLADQQTLTFASERTGGLGGYDQYIANWNADGTWSNPSPISIVNSKNDDLYISIPAGGDYVYYNVTTKNGMDVVRSLLPLNLKPKAALLLQIKFLAKDVQDLKPSVVVYKKQKSYLVYPNEENIFFIALNKNDDVELTLQADYKKYVPQIMRFKLDTLKKYSEQYLNINLNGTAQQKGVYYFSKYPNEDIDKEIFKNELTVLTRWIKENPNANFVIEYVIDSANVSESATNSETKDSEQLLKSTQMDAERLKAYLEKNNIGARQISIQPIEKIYVNTPNCSFSENKSVIYLKIRSE